MDHMAIEPTASRPTHDELVAGLAARYADPFWCLLPKVHDAPGWDKGRTIDAMALEAANVAADAIGQNEQTARAPERD